ncbi:hypothetical protein D6D26_06896 [Aureobasidium pullulans]|nr:hypothetical protein D6D26_06896 [Aureobasidium pullulans]
MKGHETNNMKLPSLASVYLVFGLAHGAALSEKVLVEAHSQIMGNASAVLGWQLAGSQQSIAPLQMGCKDITSLGHGNWISVGLDSDVIEDVFCTAASAPSNASATALAEIKLSVTDIFITQLLNAFGDNTEVSAQWLCKNFNYTAMNDELALDSGRVGRAFCLDRPYGTDWVNPTHEVDIVADPRIYDLASYLAAILYTFSASSPTERWVMCEQYHYMAQAQLKLGINSNIVREELCVDHDIPLMTAHLVQTKMAGSSTNIFEQQLIVATDAAGDEKKMTWLCENIEHRDLGLLGMTPSNSLFCLV